MDHRGLWCSGENILLFNLKSQIYAIKSAAPELTLQIHIQI